MVKRQRTIIFASNYNYSMLRAYLLFSVLLIISASCKMDKSNDNVPTVTEENASDPHSYSNFNEINTKHLDLELDINFENKTVYGVARHLMENKNDADTATFDIKALSIQKVTLGEKGNEIETDFVIGENHSLRGQPLHVKLKPGTKHINIYYQTTEETEAIDWLPKELTFGKKYPYMYTQGQAILTRSWIPVQDTPQNRITYSATVKVPQELLAIMSANNPKAKSPDGVYHFEMQQAIPVYLIAIAVGDMQYTSLSDNSGVYSEPELAEACAYEFVDLPKMIKAAEKLYGPYRWDQYDLVILPYSFPFGGMENPRLTFANPTVIAGDRSSVSVIAHELAHSWSGNLVTNATWNDFWLNEGFTVYFENRIMEEIYGKEVAEILRVIERQELEHTLEVIETSDHPEDSQLKLELDSRNPDDGMTEIAYIKGAFMLRTLEKEVGREKFDQFLRSYFDKHAFETISTEAFIDYLNKELLEPNNIAFNTEEWIYQPGIPENCVEAHSERLDKMASYAQAINEGKDVFKEGLKGVKRSDLTTQEWQAFIRNISDTVAPESLQLIDKHLDFKGSGNRAIMSEWFQLNVNAGNKEVRPEMRAHLNLIGRRWLIEGIYQSLKDSEDPEDLEWAKNVFEEAKQNYHYVSKITIEEILY